jgi:hypothetical protein
MDFLRRLHGLVSAEATRLIETGTEEHCRIIVSPAAARM